MSEKRRDDKGRILKTGESQRKDGRYQYRFTDANGKRHTIYAANLQELRVKEEDIDKCKAFHVEYTKGCISVKELLSWYMETKNNLCPGSIATYITDIHRIEKHSDIMNMKIKDVTTADVRELHQRLIREGYAPSTVARTRNDLLYPAFKMAYNDGIIIRNPCRFKLDLPPKNKKQSLTIQQQQRLLNFVKNSQLYSPQYDWIFILLNTGLRIGELLGLTMKDVDMEKRIIRVDHQIQTLSYNQIGHFITKTKTESGTRIIPMTNAVYESFCRVISSRPDHALSLEIDGFSDFIFFTRNDTIRTYSTVAYLMKQIRNAFNQKYPDDPIYLSAHVLRHTFCTNLVQSGANIKTVQYLMGHKHISTSLDIYTHSHFSDISEEIIHDIESSSQRLMVQDDD